MAPTGEKMKRETFKGRGGNWNKPRNDAHGVKKKKKWMPEHKMYEGNVKEGQGFAFKRKQKIKHAYNKLLRKERRKNPETKQSYQEEYPEHLKHLYVAESEKLKQEAWSNTFNRRKSRMKGPEKTEAVETDFAAKPAKTVVKEVVVEAGDGLEAGPGAGAGVEAGAGPGVGVGVGVESEPTDSVTGNPEPTPAPVNEILPISNRMRKKMLKKTSYQKTREEFERIKEKRKRKKEEYLKNKQQREEAIQRYKKKKMEMYQMLCKKTKKGQPNLNLQMEYLLQKIQKP